MLGAFAGGALWTRPAPVTATPLPLGGNTNAAVFGNIYDVTDFNSVQDALDEVPSASKLYFPASGGPYQPPDTSGWQIRKSVEIFGDGMNTNEGKGLQPFSLSKDGCIFNIRGSTTREVYIHDIVMSTGNGVAATGGVGDYVRFTSDTTLERLRIERCWLLYAGRSAIYASGTFIVGLSMRDVHVYRCGGHGIYLHLPALFTMNGCSFLLNCGMGAVLIAPGNGTSISGCNFESNGDRLPGSPSTTFPSSFGQGYNAQLYLENGEAAITGCNIEDTASKNPTQSLHGITLNAMKGCLIGGNEIDNGTAVAGTIGINIKNGSFDNTIASNHVTRMQYAVKINSASEDWGNVVLPQYIASPTATGAGLVSVPTGGYNFAIITNQSATGSTNKIVGLLLPSIATNGNQPDSLTDAYSTILQQGLLATGGDSLFLRRAGSWKLVN